MSRLDKYCELVSSIYQMHPDLWFASPSEVYYYYHSIVNFSDLDKREINLKKMAAGAVIDLIIGDYYYEYRTPWCSKTWTYHSPRLNVLDLPNYLNLLYENEHDIFDASLALLKHFGIRFPGVEPEVDYDPDDVYTLNGNIIKTVNDFKESSVFIKNPKIVRYLYELLIEIIRLFMVEQIVKK